MATSANASAKGDLAESKPSRKRKRGRPDIPGFSPSMSSTPSVVSKSPRGINVGEFSESRAFEIYNMVEAIKAADRSSGKRLFQRLPRHMRRRAMSHNVKRMPARLRYRAELEVRSKYVLSSWPRGLSDHMDVRLHASSYGLCLGRFPKPLTRGCCIVDATPRRLSYGGMRFVRILFFVVAL